MFRNRGLNIMNIETPNFDYSKYMTKLYSLRLAVISEMIFAIPRRLCGIMKIWSDFTSVLMHMPGAECYFVTQHRGIVECILI